MLHILKYKDMVSTQPSLCHFDFCYDKFYMWMEYPVEIPKQSFGNRYIKLRENDKIYIA